MLKLFLWAPLLAAYLKGATVINIKEAGPLSLKRSTMARQIAVLIGIGVGFVQLGVGFQALFVLTNRDTWLDAVTVLAMTFSLLPLSILGLFRPRIAAYCLFFNVAMVSLRLAYMLTSDSFAFGDLSVIVHLVPQLIVGSLLLYSADRAVEAVAIQNASGENSNSQRRIARLAAVGLGVIAGAVFFKLGSSWLLKLAHDGGWFDAILITVASFALLPFSVVGFWKPRIASYLLFTSVALAALGSIYTSGVPTSFPASFHLSLLLAPEILLPLIVGGLLLYSGSTPNADLQ
jgi:hypothetical protein